MMTDNIKHTLFFKQLHLRRFALISCFIILLVLPNTSFSFTIATIGESYSKDRYIEYCGIEHFETVYNSNAAACWPCDVINSLMNALLIAVYRMIDTVNELAKLILLLGAAIWLAIYFLKSVSAMVLQDSARVLDDAFTFTFKVAVMYVLIDGGIANIINWIITPLLSIGMDVSDALKEMV